MRFRPLSRLPTRLTIRSQSGATHRANWASDQYRMDWPADLPLTEGASYTISSSVGLQPVRVTVAVLPAGAPSDTAGLATRLLERGCTGQLDTLIATRSDRTAPVVTSPRSRISNNRGR